MTTGTHKRSMIYAMWMIAKQGNTHQQRIKINSRTFEYIREEMAKETGKIMKKANKGQTPWNKGKSISPTTNKKWKVTDSDNNVEIIEGLSAWCRNHDLNYGSLWAAMKMVNLLKGF